MNSGPLASIVIVSWNGRQYLEPCLTAVAAQQGVDAETILVDNRSTDGTAAFVRERVRAPNAPGPAARGSAWSP
jgi:GT2 family glycosyltransferase